MKKATFDKAVSIQKRIDVAQFAIDRMDVTDCNGPSIMITTHYINDD